jgi:hypothetical protein
MLDRPIDAGHRNALDMAELRLEEDRQCILVLMGATADGQKELIALLRVTVAAESPGASGPRSAPKASVKSPLLIPLRYSHGISSSMPGDEEDSLSARSAEPAEHFATYSNDAIVVGALIHANQYAAYLRWCQEMSRLESRLNHWKSPPLVHRIPRRTRFRQVQTRSVPRTARQARSSACGATPTSTVQSLTEWVCIR